MDKLIENVAAVTSNKQALLTSPPCERVLGSNNVVRAATLGLQNSDLLGLITAHLLVKRLTERNDSGEVNKAYKDGLVDFTLFLAECVTELEANKQQSAPKL